MRRPSIDPRADHGDKICMRESAIDFAGGGGLGMEEGIEARRGRWRDRDNDDDGDGDDEDEGEEEEEALHQMRPISC